MTASDIDIRKILKLLPHRYPILLVDRVLEFEPQKRIKTLKNVTINEPYFMGHFPEQPVMPGVMILEALAQSAGLLTFGADMERKEGALYYFVGIDGDVQRRVHRQRDDARAAHRPDGYVSGVSPAIHLLVTSSGSSTSSRRRRPSG